MVIWCLMMVGTMDMSRSCCGYVVVGSVINDVVGGLVVNNMADDGS